MSGSERSRVEQNSQVPFPTLGQFVLATAAVGVVVGLRWALQGVLQADAPLLAFVLAVAVAAWAGGMWLGFYATALSAAMAMFLFYRPIGSIQTELPDKARVALFLIVGMVVSALCHALRRQTTAAQRHALELARARDEAHHRFLEAEKAQQTLAQLLAHVPEGITMVGAAPEFPIVAHSRLALELLGQPVEALVGMRSGEHAVRLGLYEADGIARPDPETLPLYRASHLGEETHDRELVIIRPDQTRLTIRANATPIRAEDGRILGAISCWRDVTERKDSERELANAFEQLDLALAGAEAGAWDWNLVTGEIQWSPRSRELFGGEGDEPRRYQDWLERIHPQDRPRIEERLEEVLAGDSQWNEQYRIVLPRDEVRWMSARGRVYRDESGQPLRMAGISFDITRQKHDADELQRVNAILNGISSTTPDLIYVKNREGQMIFANPACVTAIGRSQEQVLGHSDVEWGHIPQETVAIQANDQKILREGVSQVFEETFTGPQGKRVYLSSKSPLRDSAGEVVGLIGISTDITQRLEVETALRESQERFQLATLAASVGIWDWDATTGQVNWSGDHFRLAGISREEFDGTTRVFLQAVHPNDRQRLRSAIRSAREQRQEIWEDEYRFLHRDGRVVWVAGRSRIEYDAEGKTLRMTGVCIDITQRKQAEQAFRESQERLALAVEGAGMATWDADLSTGEALWSSTHFTLLGLPPTPDLKASISLWKERIHPDDRRTVVAAAEESRRNARPYAIEYRAIRADTGEVRWLATFGTVVCDESGKAVRSMGVFFDVTQQKQAVQALEEREAYFRELMQSMPQVVWTNRTDGTFDFINRQWSQYTGQSLDFVRSTPDAWLAALHPDDRLRVANTFRQSVRMGQGFDLEARFRRNSDGEYRWYLNRCVPLRDEQNRIFKFLGTCTDIDDQKATENQLRLAAQQLKESEERFRLANRAARIGTFRWDAATQQFLWDEQHYDLFGLSPEQDVQLNAFLKAIHPDDRPRVQATVQAAIDGLLGQEELHLEYRLFRPGGELRWAKMIGRIVPDGPKPSRIFGVSIDITDQKQVEAKLHRAATEREFLLDAERAARSTAERAGRMKDEFLATLSHELRTPLNAVLGYATLIRMANMSGAELTEAVATIERNARVQAQLIEDLLDMNRIISGKLKLEIESIDLSEVLTAALETVLPSAEARRIPIDCSVDPQAGLVRGDPARLQQVFWNLLSNAIKFTPPGGSVRVTLRRSESTIDLAVQDTGQGILPEFLPYVFDRFRQADATTTRKHGGLGLGLSIVKQLVELHGGSIRAESLGKDQGATFVVSLPLATDYHQDNLLSEHRLIRESAELPWAVAQPDLTGVRVLVVDDEPDASALIARSLAVCQAEVATANSAATAFALLEQQSFDVLVSDIGMPEEDGYDLIRRVRSLPDDRNGQIPAVALTAFVRSEDRRRAALAGFQTHMSKPVEAGELVAIVASLAGRTGSVPSQDGVS
jgi:PAS domain S-box-containing protein